MNNGYKQAYIAYRVTPDGQAVDVEGQLTSVSGKRQAIALLSGRSNPDVNLYEVAFYYSKKGLIEGQPTTSYDTDSCPVSIFKINNNYIVLTPGDPEKLINIFSSFGWELQSGSAIVNVVPVVGPKGDTSVKLTRTSTTGQNNIKFRDTRTGETKEVYVVNAPNTEWVLTGNSWGNLKFWYDAEIWTN